MLETTIVPAVAVPVGKGIAEVPFPNGAEVKESGPALLEAAVDSAPPVVVGAVPAVEDRTPYDVWFEKGAEVNDNGPALLDAPVEKAVPVEMRVGVKVMIGAESDSEALTGLPVLNGMLAVGMNAPALEVAPAGPVELV